MQLLSFVHPSNFEYDLLHFTVSNIIHRHWINRYVLDQKYKTIVRVMIFLTRSGYLSINEIKEILIGRKKIKTHSLSARLEFKEKLDCNCRLSIKHLNIY